MLNLRVKVFDDFLLDVLRHRQIVHIIYDCIAVRYDIHKARHDSSQTRPQVLLLRLSLRQLRWWDLLRSVLIVWETHFKFIHLCLHLTKEVFSIRHLKIIVVDCCCHCYMELMIWHKWLCLSNQAAQSKLFVLVQFGCESEQGSFFKPADTDLEISRVKRLAFLVLD